MNHKTATVNPLQDVGHQIHDLVYGSTTAYPWATLVVAALVWGFVMASLPRALRILGVGYGLFLAGLFYLQGQGHDNATNTLFVALAAGAGVAFLSSLVRPRARRA